MHSGDASLLSVVASVAGSFGLYRWINAKYRPRNRVSYQDLAYARYIPAKLNSVLPVTALHRSYPTALQRRTE